MKGYFLTAFILVAFSFAYLTYSARSVEGVEVDRYYLKTYNLVEEYQYYRNIRLVVFDQNAAALQRFINTNCDGGAGCYAHGKTLVQILITTGDEKFSQLLIHLNSKDLNYLYSFLQAGHEYGNFPSSDNEKELEQDFPKTLKLLKENVRHQTSDIRPNSTKDL